FLAAHRFELAEFAEPCGDGDRVDWLVELVEAERGPVDPAVAFSVEVAGVEVLWRRWCRPVLMRDPVRQSCYSPMVSGWPTWISRSRSSSADCCRPFV